MASFGGDESAGDDEDVDADEDDFGVVRQSGEAEAEGKDGEASNEQAEVGEEADGGPESDGDEDVADVVCVGVAHGFWEEAVGAHQFGDGGAFFLVVFEREGGVWAVACAEFVDTSHEEAKGHPEAEEEVSGREGEIKTRFFLGSFGHEFVWLWFW